jgi:hypothetical protein
MKRTTLFTAICIIVPCLGLVAHAQNSELQNAVKPIVVMAGADSNVHGFSNQRITTPDDWASIWSGHLGKSVDDAYRPTLEVDFDRCLVVAIFRGEEVNVRGIKINSTFETKDSIVIRFEDVGYQTSGADNNKRPDRPYAFVVLPKTSKSIVLEENTQRYKGAPPVWTQCARLDKAQAAGSKTRERGRQESR